jgi:hypothetical protein
VNLGSIHLEFPASPGFLLSSPKTLSGLKEGGEYDPDASPVKELIDEQQIILLQTGSPELDYQLHFHSGDPDRQARVQSSFGMRVDGGALVIRDGYDLMDWSDSDDQRLTIEDGYYAVDALWTPGEAEMEIHFYFNRTDSRVDGDGMVELMWSAE